MGIESFFACSLLILLGLGKLGIPTKSIIVSEVISITRSEVMPIKIGAKRRWFLSSWRSDRHRSRKFRCFFFLAVVLSFEGRLGLGRSVAQRRPLGRRVLGVAWAQPKPSGAPFVASCFLLR